MKFYRVGIEVAGRRAYCYSVLSFLCSFDKELAIMATGEDVAKIQNWIGYMIPNAATFFEEAGETTVSVDDSECAACEHGHCRKHLLGS